MDSLLAHTFRQSKNINIIQFDISGPADQIFLQGMGDGVCWLAYHIR